MVKRRGRALHVEKSSTECGSRSRWSFCKAVGLGTGGSLSGTRDRKAGQPPCRRDLPI
jgi:hypothetical protein